jgi:hypothetical protein
LISITFFYLVNFLRAQNVTNHQFADGHMLMLCPLILSKKVLFDIIRIAFLHSGFFDRYDSYHKLCSEDSYMKFMKIQ